MKMTDPLESKVRDYCQKWDMLPQGGTVLCAVSGGQDSMALLHLLSVMAGGVGFQVAAAHFNHQLRCSAGRDEEFVRNWCRDHGIPFTCGRGDVGDFAKREGLSVEDAARVLRYAFLQDAAEDLGADRIAVAHHRDDNAETLLLHLIRGAGMQGLGGIPPVRGKIVRPLLNVSRDEIHAYVIEHSLPFVEDESNRDPAYTRNRLRLEVLPLLEEIAPGCGGRIAAAAVLAREENEYMRKAAGELLPMAHDNAITLPVSTLQDKDEVLRRRLVRGMALRLGESLNRRQTDAVLRLENNRFLDLPGGLCAVRTRHELTIKRQSPLPPLLALREGCQAWGDWQVTLERQEGPVEETACRVVLRDAGSPLAIAPWDGTGRLRVENGSRTIKRLFADKGIPVGERMAHPAVLVNGKIAAVFGVAVDWNYRPVEGEAALAVTLRGNKTEKGEK